MKVLFISQAGMHIYVQHLWRSFARIGIELTVIVPAVYYPDHVGTEHSLELERPLEQDGYRLVPVPLRNPHKYFMGFDLSALAAQVRRCDPDIIHVLDEPVSSFLKQAIWIKVRYGLAARIVSYGFENLPLPHRPLFRMKWRLLWRWLAGATASNSEALENLRSAGYPGDRPCERIFWGTALEMYRPLDRGALRKKLNADFPYVVGGVGGFLPQKGFHVLLDAVAVMPQQVHCILIGSGPAREELEQRAAMPDLRGRVHFVAQVPPETVVEYMNTFDLFVIPSLTTATWKEQFGKVIAEAMACGVPVIGSDSGAIPEVIGDAGIVVPEGDAAALAAAMNRVHGDPALAAELAAKGTERARTELGMEAFAARHDAFYRRVLGMAP